MAGEFLRSHGINIDVEMSNIQFAEHALDEKEQDNDHVTIANVRLPSAPIDSTWDVAFSKGYIVDIKRRDAEVSSEGSRSKGAIDAKGSLLAQSLCHPHVHLDKAYILSHPRYSTLQVSDGDFNEALALTERAKSQFSHEDLLERGQRLIDESTVAGVTHMRAFVEVDAGVRRTCLEAGLALKKRAEDEQRCVVQLCAFAQRPLFSPTDGDEGGSIIRDLMRQSACHDRVDAIGSTPYVEAGIEEMKRNISWMVSLSMEMKVHLDFHLDYHLEPQKEPMVWYVIEELQRQHWTQRNEGRTVVFGHCTRLALFQPDEWRRLASTITDSNLPIAFVGLPTSDLYMMRTAKQPEVRGTLDVPQLIKEHGINACIGINNIGNAFTPYGTCDPLSLASLGVGLYQAGTQRDAEILYECVSTRAKAAIGLGREGAVHTRLEVGEKADLVRFDGDGFQMPDWCKRKTIADAVYLYDNSRHRQTFFNGLPTTR